MSSISSTTTSQLTQERLKDCRHLVFRSSLGEGHFARWIFRLVKAPTHNFPEIAVVQIASGTRLVIATNMCLFHLLRQTAITAIF